MVKQLKIKAAIMLILELLLLAFLGGFLLTVQTRVAITDQRAAMEVKVNQMPDLMAEADAAAKSVIESFDEAYNSKAKTAAYIAQYAQGYDETQDCMLNMATDLKVTNIMVIDRGGKLKATAHPPLAEFRYDRFNQLREVFSAKGESVPFTVNFASGSRRYYAASIDHNRAIIIEQDTAELNRLLESTNSWESILSDLPLGNTGRVIAISSQDNTFLYHPNEEMIGQDAISAGMDISLLKNNTYGWQTIRGQRFYCGTAELEDSRAYVVFAIPYQEISESVNMVVFVSLFMAFVVISLVIVYGILLLYARELHGDKDNVVEFGPFKLDKNVSTKVSAVAMVGLVFVVVVSFFMQTLYSVSAYSNINNAYVIELEKSMEESREQSQRLTDMYNERYLNKCWIAAQTLTYNPDLRTRADLIRMAEALNVSQIYVFDRNGEMTATSAPVNHFTISQDPEQQSYAFNKLLGGMDTYIQEAMPEEVSGKMTQYIGVALVDEEGSNDGFVQIAVEPERLNSTLESTTEQSLLSRLEASSGGLVFSVDEEGTILYHRNPKMVGRCAFDFGLAEDKLRAVYNDYISLDGVTYYAAVYHNDGKAIFVAVPESAMLSVRLPATIATGAVTFFSLLLVFTVLNFHLSYFDKFVPVRKKRRETNVRFETRMPDGSIKVTQSAASRWTGEHSAWSEMTPEQQLSALLLTLMSIFAIIICVCMGFKDQFFSETSVFARVANGQWQKGMNIFAVTAAILIICVIAVAAMLARQLLATLAKASNARMATICRLLRSIVRYFAVLVGVFSCLNLFGVDTSTLLASAGILSLVIGLGSQKLIGDILAGLFIIFEGEFRVGDIITIGDWRGTVSEIGVRTTKVEDSGGNVKIFANSAVSGVVNMTQRLSLAPVDVGINYDESLERVEEILARELPRIKDRVPGVLMGPDYKGVQSMDESCVTLRITARCKEDDRVKVIRSLNRELLLMFKKYSIEIPYNQLVLHNGDILLNAQPEERVGATE